eukprot:3137198-Amphidinium_carterae.1
MWFSLVHVLLVTNAVRESVPGAWTCFAFIDDLTIVAPSQALLSDVVAAVERQLTMLGLVLNRSKSSWTASDLDVSTHDGHSDHAGAAVLADRGDADSASMLQWVDQSILLGADLCATPCSVTVSTKRLGRMEETKSRLLRACHLPCAERKRTMIIASTAMSPMGWIPVGTRPLAKDLRVIKRLMLKAIFGHSTFYRETAYEVVIAVLHQGHRLDPSWQCIHELA